MNQIVHRMAPSFQPCTGPHETRNGERTIQPASRPRQAAAQSQTGAISLLVVITLVILASLASLYSANSVWVDQLASQNQNQATQLRWGAEAALAWARAELARQGLSSPSSFAFWNEAPLAPCPTKHPAPRWQCARMVPPPYPDGPAFNSQVLAIRDLVDAPHVTELQVTTQISGQAGQAQVRASVFVPTWRPTPDGASEAAVVLNGCMSVAAGARVALCPAHPQGQACGSAPTGEAVLSHWLADANGDGQISTTEVPSCLTLPPQHLPGGGTVRGTTEALPRWPCSLAAWKSVLGDITPEQVQAWSSAQARNGLHALSQPARSIYWVDSPATWTESLGQANAPVLLVFSAQACALRCPSLASGVHIHGTVVLQTQCQDDKARGWQAGHIDGQLVVESGLMDLQSGSLVQAQRGARAAFELAWPAGLDTRTVQRVAGSWREGSP